MRKGATNHPVRIGAWGDRLVLFGGLAPRYIVPEVPADVPEHTGTTDLDVVVGLAVGGEDAAVYSKLQEELKNAGFEQSRQGSYAWERRVDTVRVVLKFFCPVEEGGEPGRLKRNPGGSAGSTVSAIQLRGAELAAADCATRTLSGEVLDHGGNRQVEVRIVNILPFLVLKAFALETRDKEKDAYDIVWTLNAFGDRGPEDAAEAAAGSPIADSEHVVAAMELLEARFNDLEDQGPSNSWTTTLRPLAHLWEEGYRPLTSLGEYGGGVARQQKDLLQGTLGLLIMQSLAGEERHGYGIARWIRDASGDVLDVPEGSLYPALRRLEDRGLIESRWDLSENNRRARFYSLTTAGRRHLRDDAGAWSRYAKAVSLVLRTDPPAI